MKLKQEQKATGEPGPGKIKFHIVLDLGINSKLEADAKRLRRSRRAHVAHLLTQFYEHPHTYADLEK